LSVHFPNKQNVVIENKAIEETMIPALNQITMIINYFSLNSCEGARQYLYIEILLLYV